MNSTLLNFMEILNESIIYFCGIFISIFTQWICDPLQRYKYGFLLVYVQIAVVGTNVTLILYELLKALHKANQKRKWLNQWNNYFKNVYVQNYQKQQHIKPLKENTI